MAALFRNVVVRPSQQTLQSQSVDRTNHPKKLSFLRIPRFAYCAERKSPTIARQAYRICTLGPPSSPTPPSLPTPPSSPRQEPQFRPIFVFPLLSPARLPAAV